MPGGLDGRMQREQLKAMKLRNAQQAMEMNSMGPLVQQAAGIQQIAGADQESRMRAMLAPQAWEQGQQQIQDSQMKNQAQGMEMAQQGGFDIKQLLQQYLQNLGMSGELQPLPQQDFGFGAPAPASDNSAELIRQITESARLSNEERRQKLQPR